jgi:C4-type Zn-finger protein
MTNSWECPDCGGTLKITDTNGAEYPDPLVEERSCENCEYSRSEVLTA